MARLPDGLSQGHIGTALALLLSTKERANKPMSHIANSLNTPLLLPRKRARIGRNSPCPCNSGKKFKHCRKEMG